MRHLLLNVLFSLNVLWLTSPFAQADETSAAGAGLNIATISTNLGEIKLELLSEKAPETVKNFIQYAKSGFYKGTVFHRVIPNFMIQGGGFDQQMTKKPTRAPIKNEASPLIKNLRGTIAMARTNDPHSATSQFFINVVDNGYLDKSTVNPGYAVFGKIIEGMEYADNISKVKTTRHQYMQNVPVEPIIITNITIHP